MIYILAAIVLAFSILSYAIAAAAAFVMAWALLWLGRRLWRL